MITIRVGDRPEYRTRSTATCIRVVVDPAPESNKPARKTEKEKS